MTTPRTCPGCGVKPVATPRHSRCYDCLPGGPLTPPPCRKCGSDELYYSAGLCRRCHRFAPHLVDSCRDCLGWGVTRTSSWLCEGCRGWRRRFSTGAPCRSCARPVPVNDEDICRLCWRASAGARPHGIGPSVLEANRRFGQQLFFVDLFRQKRPPRTVEAPVQPRHGAYPVAYQQLTLMEAMRERRVLDTAGEPRDPRFALLLDLAARDHGHRHGWSMTTLLLARRGLRILAALQDTPGARIRASDVAQLDTAAFSRQPIIDILSGAGLLEDDRMPSITTWFARKTADLPEPMTEEVRVWFEVMVQGSSVRPRSHPLSRKTARVNVHNALPALTAWAHAGHTSLRTIGLEEIREALPAQGSPRSQVGMALKSLFRTLKGRRMVFADPVARIRTGRPETRMPLPIDPGLFSAALGSQDPARALIAALVGFHALRSHQVRSLLLTDIRDGRIHVQGRTILLAPSAARRLGAWLEHRSTRWPNSSNPHLLLNKQTAVRNTPVSQFWVNTVLGLRAQDVREDRILDEAMATQDLRRLCDLFDLSVKGAERYLRTAEGSERKEDLR